MAKRYPSEVKEIIYALLADGVKPAEIRRRLAAQTAGLPYPVEMPRRTLTDYIGKLRRERGEPRHRVDPGAETDAAAALRRRTLEYASGELKKIERAAKGRDSEPSASDIRLAREVLKLATDIETSDRLAQKAKAGTQLDGARDAARVSVRGSALERLQKLAAADSVPASGLATDKKAESP